MRVSQPCGDNKVPTKGAAPTEQARAYGADKLGTPYGNNIGYQLSAFTERSPAMNRIVYIVGLIVIVLVVLSFLGLR
jgi:hypothetical protein